jgi:hypothetical protein
VVSTSSDDCYEILSEKECRNKIYNWFTEPEQIESSNDLMLLYNDSLARYNSTSFYVPPSEYTVLRLVTYGCVLFYDAVDFVPYITRDP